MYNQEFNEINTELKNHFVKEDMEREKELESRREQVARLIFERKNSLMHKESEIARVIRKDNSKQKSRDLNSTLR